MQHEQPLVSVEPSDSSLASTNGPGWLAVGRRRLPVRFVEEVDPRALRRPAIEGLRGS